MAPSKREKLGITLLTLATTSIANNVNDKKRKHWTKKWLLKRKQLCHTNIIKELEPLDIINFLRMDANCFNELLDMVAPLITKQDTVMRDSISAEERLIMTLRYLSTGRNYEDLKFSAIVSPQFLSKSIPETCWAIYNSLKQYIKMPTTEMEWKEIATNFEERWNFNHCIGAMDGMHIAIEKPPNSGSSYYNYKNFFSVVLFAVVNANYEFMYVHTGTNGSVSDGGILRNTQFYKKLVREELKLPPSSTLPDTNISVPYVFVGDSAFAINRHIMRPYPFKNISHQKRIFNYRLSRARRVVENVFGILVTRFRIFRQPIGVHVDNVDAIVLACCALHNYLRKKVTGYITEGCIDNENIDDATFQQGDWHQVGHIVPLQQINERQRNDEGNNVRSLFTAYFNGHGSVPFQEDMLRTVPL